MGLPEVTWSDVPRILPIALSCFIVILAQSAATSRAYALRYRDNFDQNVDLVGLALANAAAGCSSTFVVNGSPTKTAIVDAAGGRSQWSQPMVTALMDLHKDLAKAGVVLAVSRLQLRSHGDLERMGLVQLIGANRIFDSRHACIEAYQSEAKS